jgi:hypothetical protein
MMNAPRRSLLTSAYWHFGQIFFSFFFLKFFSLDQWEVSWTVESYRNQIKYQQSNTIHIAIYFFKEDLQDRRRIRECC